MFKVTNPLILELMAKEPDKKVRAYVAESEFATVDMLKLLAKDKYVLVRYAVARNKNSTNEILDSLINDVSHNVRSAVARYSSNINSLIKLTEDRASIVRYCVCINKHANEQVLILSLKDATIAYNIARHHNITEKICNILISDNGNSGRKLGVFENLARNDATPIKYLKYLSDVGPNSVKLLIINNRNSSIDILNKLSKDANPDVSMTARKAKAKCLL